MSDNEDVSEIAMEVPKDKGKKKKKKKKRTKLYRLIKEQQFAAALEMIDQADVNLEETGKNGMNALLHASRHGNVEIVSALVVAKADVNTKNSNGWTCLMYASVCSSVECVSVFLEQKCDVDAVSIKGKTALMCAAVARAENQEDRNKCIQMLLNAQADVNAQCPGDENWTPLIWATCKNQVQAVEVLIRCSQGLDLERRGTENLTALHWACRMGHGECAKLLIKEGANIEAKDETQNTPLIWACAMENFGAESETPDAEAPSAADPNVVIIHQDAPSKREAGPLKCIELLLDEKANVNAVAQSGMTALHWAVKANSYAACQLLLDRKADAGIANLSDFTARDVAQHMQFEELVQLFNDYEMDQTDCATCDVACVTM